MTPRATDTEPDAYRLQIELLRGASPARRVALALSVSQSVIDLARHGLRRPLDDASTEDVGLRFIEIHYGRELARQVRDYLASGRR
jgi:hypothetical protein